MKESIPLRKAVMRNAMSAGCARWAPIVPASDEAGSGENPGCVTPTDALPDFFPNFLPDSPASDAASAAPLASGKVPRAV